MKNFTLTLAVIVATLVAIPNMAMAQALTIDCSPTSVKTYKRASQHEKADCCANPAQAKCEKYYKAEKAKEPAGEKVSEAAKKRKKAADAKRKKDAAEKKRKKDAAAANAAATPPVSTSPDTATPESPDLEQRLKRIEDKLGLGEEDEQPLTMSDGIWMMMILFVLMTLVQTWGIPYLRSRMEQRGERIRTIQELEELLLEMGNALANRPLVDEDADIDSIEDLVAYLKERKTFSPD